MTSSGTTTSLWMATHEIPAFPTLEQSIETEVVIVGAGMAGITTAYVLAKKGVPVVLLEKGPILRGETERTTAHLASALDDRWFEVIRIHGEEKAKKAAESHTAAIDFIEQTAKAEGIECDFARVDGWLFLGEGDDESLLDKELKAAHAVGLTGVEKLPHTPLPETIGVPCLRFPNQARFHPTAYLAGLAKAAQKAGAKIFTMSPVVKIDEDAQPVRVYTDAKHTVTAKALIVTTCAPINDNALIYAKQAAYRSYVLGFDIPKGKVDGLWWDTPDPYHYVRIARDEKDDAEILIVGGEDHRTGTEDDAAQRYERLTTWTRAHFPAAKDERFRWSGQVFETADGLAMIGRKPGGEAWSFICTGDSGMGMTHGTIAGMMFGELARGGDHEWAEIYDPGRTPIKAGVTLLKENAETAFEAVKDWIKPSEAKTAGDIKPGSGAVLRKGVTKIALYRDDAGAFHACSAVCPHKGCIVQWNDGEKSWDCPCHGSRYDAKGTVLTGPTRKNLERLPEWKQHAV